MKANRLEQELRARTWDYMDLGGPIGVINGEDVRPFMWIVLFFRDGESLEPMPLDTCVTRCNVAEGWVEYTENLYNYDLDRNSLFQANYAAFDHVHKSVVKRNKDGRPNVYRLEGVQDLILDVVDGQGNVLTTLRGDV